MLNDATAPVLTRHPSKKYYVKKITCSNIKKLQTTITTQLLATLCLKLENKVEKKDACQTRKNRKML